jgi:hypothetical protein
MASGYESLSNMNESRFEEDAQKENLVAASCMTELIKRLRNLAGFRNARLFQGRGQVSKFVAK